MKTSRLTGTWNYTKAEKVRVTLENMSEEPGTCLNDEAEEGAKEADLTIASQGDWAVAKEGEGASTKYTAIRPLPNQDPPQQMTTTSLRATASRATA